MFYSNGNIDMPLKVKLQTLTSFLYKYFINLIENILFLDKCFEMKFLMHLRLLRTLESKNHNFSGFHGCVCALSVSVIIMTQK